LQQGEQIPLKAGENIRYVVPHKLDKAHLAEDAGSPADARHHTD
jgi:hypothetical protein